MKEDKEVKKKAGRPKAKIDVEMIEKLAKIHCTPREMGYIMGVDHRTIIKHHGDVIERGKANGRLAIRRKQIEVALSGDKTLLIWLGKVLLNQSETQMHDEDSKILPWNDDI
jgi:DNA-binding CsgD family transcriptional regulator